MLRALQYKVVPLCYAFTSTSFIMQLTPVLVIW